MSHSGNARDMYKQPLIFDIKRYSINDGPGVRVTVFFKGCPLHCAWCHNPESQSPRLQKLYNAANCIGCQACVNACPEGALKPDPIAGIVSDFSRCVCCGNCAAVCPSKAMEMSGSAMTEESVMEAIRKETLILDTSGGGVTFSGGEPLMFPDMLVSLLKTCGAEGFHRAVDTSGHASPDILLRVAEHTDLFLYDLKHMDPELHRQYTGVPNELILENLRLLAREDIPLIIRIPLIGGVNADETNMEATASFVASLPGAGHPVNLLPYHAIAARKYEKLGKAYNDEFMHEPSHEQLEKITGIFSTYGLEATIGG